MPAILEEILSIESDDPGLVGLGHVGEDSVHHRDQHPVLVWVPRVLDNRNYIRPLLCNIQQIPK